VLLVPVLLLLRAPVLASVVQPRPSRLPVVVFSPRATSSMARGFLPWHGGGRVAAVGVVVGARIAHVAPAAVLRRVVATGPPLRGTPIAGQTVWQSRSVWCVNL
jgi:hypothetical protein